MQHTRVRSKTIRSYGYDRDRSVLEIEFTTGRVYRYYDVPLEEFWRFLKATSKGKFFNSSIRDTYAFAECHGKASDRECDSVRSNARRRQAEDVSPL